MSYEQTSLRCRNCRFWWPLEDGHPDPHLREHAKRGQCRRHPPPGGISVEQEWAVVHATDWCGEHSHVLS
jgi:hypothetical protein